MGNVQNNSMDPNPENYAKNSYVNLLFLEEKHIKHINDIYALFIKNPLKHCIGSQRVVYTTNKNFKKILSLDKCTNNIKAQNSYKIQAVTNIMYQLSVLNALYDPRAMHIALIKILITHRFITMADFMHYKDEFVNYIQTAFPGEISETMKSSFQKFLINYGKALISHKMLLDRLGYEIDENFVINENKHFKIDPQNGLKAELFTDENDELAETINEENIEEYEQCSQN